MITLADYQALKAEQRELLTILTFWPEPVDAARLSELTLDGKGRQIRVDKVHKALSAFRARNWVETVSTDRRTVLLLHPVARAAYLEMLREGDENHWWPTLEVAGVSSARDLFPELHRGLGQHRKVRGPDLILMEGLRCFARGSGEGASGEFKKRLNAREGVDFARAIAFCAGERFGEEPAFHLSPNDPLVTILPAYITVRFICGYAIAGLMEELHRLLASGETLPANVQEAYWSLCIWSGRTEKLIASAGSESNTIYEACQKITKGNFKLADSLFKLSDLQDESRRRSRFNPGYDNLPLRVLAAMTATAVKPEKFVRTRPSELLALPVRSFWGEGDENLFAARNYRASVEHLCDWMSHTWLTLGTVASQATPLVLQTIPKDKRPLPLTVLFAAWEFSRLKMNRKVWTQAVAKAWAQAKEYDSMGWSSLTALSAALLTGGYDAEAEAPYLKDLDTRSVRFFIRQAPEPEWKGILETLEKSLSKKPKVEVTKPDGRQFLWCLSIEENADGQTHTVGDVCPAIREKGAPEDGREDDILEKYELDRKSVRVCMSDRDRLIAGELRGYDGYYGSTNWPELLKCLCGAPNLVCRDLQADYWGDKSWGCTSAITLEKQSCQLTVTTGEDGGVILEAPDWALNCDQKWCLRDLGKGRYAFVEFTKELKKVLDVFRNVTTNGRVVIPREGMPIAESLVERLSDIMPLAEPTQNAEDIKRVPADSAVRLRLDYAEGTLLVQAVVQPLADNPNLTLDPAYGPVEKMIVGAVSNFVLVRDLAAEKAAFEPVTTALAEFSGAFDGKSLWSFADLADAIAALTKIKALGDRVPTEWMQARRLSVVTMPKSGVKLTSQRTADDWFRVDGDFTLDDGRILSIVALLDAARTRRGNFVRLSDGDYVALSSAMAKELDALNAAGRRKGDGVEIVKAAIPMLDGAFEDGADSVALPDAMAVTATEIRSAFAKRPAVPRTLNAELRPYQEDGYRWLSRLAACGFGACLADDMGLGKTIQVISLLLERAQKGPSLVVAPSSVCGNWRRELERFAPTLRPVMALEELEALTETGANDVVITSYGYLLFHEDEFAAVTWNGLILDEAQAIKNDASKRAKAVKRLHAKFRVAATGTPVENRLGELWSLFDFLNPGLLGPAASFAQRFTVEGKAVPELKRLVKPLILRRLKGDVLDDLPEKTEVTLPVILSTAERTAYEACRRQALAQLEAKAETESGANRMSILAELTRLRRFCCHPSLVLPGMGVPSAKMEALVELLEGLHEGHHRALVFSQFTDYLALVRKVLDAHNWTHLYLDGTTPTLEREKLVNAFQGGEGDFFLISLKAGGTGLNLTAANYVILLDPWWNPAVENQAADRAHRIGQKNPVTVYRLIASDTVEARVIELHQEKKAIAEDVLEGTSSTALSPAQLMKLFQ